MLGMILYTFFHVAGTMHSMVILGVFIGHSTVLYVLPVMSSCVLYASSDCAVANC